MKSVYGFGVVAFTYRGVTVTLNINTGIGEIGFDPIFWRKETINKKKVLKKLIGIRADVIIKLTNLSTNEYISIGNIFDLLNQAMANDEPITIYPRADWNSMYNISVDCFLNSKIKFEDMGRIEIGQRLELEFESEELIGSLPFLVHQEAFDYLLTEGGDKLLQENGDKLIIER